MRRSFRDAILGFSLIGGIAIFSGTMLWLRGVSMESKKWAITANFLDASGLAEGSPVTYRGIVVGSVKKIAFTPQSVQAKIEIKKKDLILPRPVIAKVVTSSILGSDVQIALISSGKAIQNKVSLPNSKTCNTKLILCEGELIQGKRLKSISSLTEEIEELLQDADKEKVIYSLSESMDQFDRTQANLDELIALSKTEIKRVGPIISQLTEAATHLNSILESLDNKETLNDLKETASSTNSITKKIDQISENMDEILNDKKLVDALRKITIGLGKLFEELYPISD